MSESNPYRRRFHRVIHPRNPITDICQHCRFFEPYSNLRPDAGVRTFQTPTGSVAADQCGQCRRDQHYEFRLLTDWCGEFKPTAAALRKRNPEPDETAHPEDLDDEDSTTQTKKVQ